MQDLGIHDCRMTCRRMYDSNLATSSDLAAGMTLASVLESCMQYSRCTKC